MASRRSRSTQSKTISSPTMTEDQINHLISRIHALVPVSRNYDSENTASADKKLQEVCNYIRNLHHEVEDLSEELSELLAAANGRNFQM